MKPKNTSLFGWINVFANYSWKDFLYDAILPFIIALILLIVALYNDADMYVQVKTMLELGVTIIPGMVALMVAAYTIMLSFILSDKVDEIKKTDSGKQFVQSINSSFAMCLLVAVLTIVLLIFMQGISSMGIVVSQMCAKVINSVAYFMSCFFLVYSVYILIGIVIDIYNSGQVTLL